MKMIERGSALIGVFSVIYDHDDTHYFLSAVPDTETA